MDEHALRCLIAQVKDGQLSRRSFVRHMVALGLTAPMATQMLSFSGVSASAQTADTFKYKPTKRGGGGPLRVLYWQGPTVLNPHFATGLKEQEGARIFHEPLARWDTEGNLSAVLAAEIPSHENGGLSEDGKTVIWKLKRNVTWHDGKPFTADDVVFNWEFASDPAAACVTLGTYREVKVEKIDSHTVKVMFERPAPFWADAFVGTRGMLIPKHLYADYTGAKSREAPNNMKPVGTGPYKFVDFKPGDMVKGEINSNYHMENRPYFDTFELKGGGDAVSAARAVLQTGEFDYGWNLQVEDEILIRLEKGGKGKVRIIDTANIEHIQLNASDPWTEVDGERSNAKTKHPLLSDPAVRQAMGLLVDRDSVQEHIYGRTGMATGNFLNYPERYRSKNHKWEFNVDKANAILEAGGWKKGADGIRAKDGKRLKFVYQTSTNTPRQKTQAIVKQACQKAGIDIELKSVTAAVFFSADVGNPDTYTKFYADIQMYSSGSPQPDPTNLMRAHISAELPSRHNKWQGRNATRFNNPEYDKAFSDAEAELDPVKRAALFIRMNDLVCGNHAVIPVVNRPRVVAIAGNLQINVSGWDTDMGSLMNWYRDV